MLGKKGKRKVSRTDKDTGKKYYIEEECIIKPVFPHDVTWAIRYVRDQYRKNTAKKNLELGEYIKELKQIDVKFEKILKDALNVNE